MSDEVDPKQESDELVKRRGGLTLEVMCNHHEFESVLRRDLNTLIAEERMQPE
jgi:hypothetical protein